MKAISKKICSKEMELITMQMAVSIRDNGCKDRKKALANIFLMMALFYKANLTMINSCNESNQTISIQQFIDFIHLFLSHVFLSIYFLLLFDQSVHFGTHHTIFSIVEILLQIKKVVQICILEQAELIRCLLF